MLFFPRFAPALPSFVVGVLEVHGLQCSILLGRELARVEHIFGDDRFYNAAVLNLILAVAHSHELDEDVVDCRA